VPADLQELLALGIVAAVAGIALASYLRRRGRKAPSCCDTGSAEPPAENVVRFYRRPREDSSAGPRDAGS
jgi:hypothetical protein